MINISAKAWKGLIQWNTEVSNRHFKTSSLSLSLFALGVMNVADIAIAPRPALASLVQIGYTFDGTEHHPVISPYGVSSQVNAINNDGVLIGNYGEAPLFPQKGSFLRDANGIFYNIDIPGFNRTLAYGINNRKTIVGGLDDGRIGYIQNTTGIETLLFPGSQGTIANAINEFVQIVGVYLDSAFQVQGYYYDAGSFISLSAPGAVNTFAQGLNDAGAIVGDFSDSLGFYRGFLYENGNYTILEYPGSTGTFVNDINNLALVVGSYYDSDRALHGFAYSNGVYTTIDFPGARVSGIKSVNDVGVYAGYAKVAYVPSPLPILGVGAAFSYSRKLRKRIKNSKTPEVMSALG